MGARAAMTARLLPAVAFAGLLALGPAQAAQKKPDPAGKSWAADQVEAPATAADPAYAAFDAGRYMEAMKLAEAAAAKGDGPSYTMLGQLYEQGLGVPQNFAKAAEYYAKGAAIGDVDSLFSLGVMLAAGQGIKQNKSQAAQFFELAAAKNHPIALYNLALIYADGSERPQDLRKAAEFLEKAANLDHAPAQYDLAGFYKEGRAIAPDDKKYLYWLGRAAEGGLPAAELEYGIALFQGYGITPPSQKAGIAMIRRAAEKGNPVAQNRLARAYAYGAGVEVNMVEAAKWHLLSRHVGLSDFKLDQIVGGLNADDRKKAEKAAFDYQQATDALLQ